METTESFFTGEEWVKRSSKLDKEVRAFRQVMLEPSILEHLISSIEKSPACMYSYEKAVLLPYLRNQIKFYKFDYKEQHNG